MIPFPIATIAFQVAQPQIERMHGKGKIGLLALAFRQEQQSGQPGRSDHTQMVHDPLLRLKAHGRAQQRVCALSKQVQSQRAILFRQMLIGKII